MADDWFGQKRIKTRNYYCLCSIGSVPYFSGKQKFGGKNQQEADSRSGENFNDKIEKAAKMQKFEQKQVAVV